MPDGSHSCDLNIAVPKTINRRGRLWLPVVLTACSILSSADAQLVPGTMDVHWNIGSDDCAEHPQPALQVHQYNPQTFILRQNPCATWEAPFIYLLVGRNRALLIETGAVADANKMPLAQKVISLLPRGEPRLPLLVVHTHGHLDHRSGDQQFRSLPNVEVMATDLESMKSHLGIAQWPNGIGQIDLGDRVLDVIPTPGHHQAQVAYYDRQTGLFFSGDLLLPGRLLIEDKDADLASARRVVAFLADRPISQVLGGHIELSESGKVFWGTSHHPHERPLQMTREDLMALPEIVSGFNGFYSQRGVYVLMNQNRILVLLGVGALVLLGTVVLLVRALWRWLRRFNTDNAIRASQ